ncbi:hypothetical protein HanXRQr2_Chr15g0721201 [Helianthus annuus]|uniref:Uncharacterized protein n=1 Tax=Helianthus annuus TaxID=4232 RepID=A0A251SGR7_HELAN|nr:hypothetical protein HanXRQr2_Chr15g0721201 [Helianthus annuus]
MFKTRKFYREIDGSENANSRERTSRALLRNNDREESFRISLMGLASHYRLLTSDRRL